MSTLFSDDFNRSDGTLNTGDWEQVGTAYQQMSIASNTVQATSGDNSRRCSRVKTSTETFPDDQWAEIVVTARTSTALFGPCVRCGTPASEVNAYVGRRNNGNWTITRYSTVAGNGDAATVAFTTAPEPSLPYTMRVEAIGDEITLYVNDVAVVSATDSTHASGQPGLFLFTQGGATLDDFAAGDFSAGTTEVTSDSDLRWSILQSLQKDLTTQWDILGIVNADVDARWDILQLINADSDLRWSVLQQIAQDLELRWNSDGSVTSVSSDVTLQWSIIAAIAQSLQLDWSILQSITGDADIRWSVLAAAAKDLTAQWDVRQVVEAGATLQWSIVGTAEKSLTLRWSIESDTQFPDITGTITIQTATPRVSIDSVTPHITIH